MDDLKSLLKDYKIEDKYKYVTREYQDFGLRIAGELNDFEHRSLYIKIAKTEDRNLVEEAFGFAKHYNNASNKARVFMWKLKELRQELKEKRAEANRKLKNAQTKLL